MDFQCPVCGVDISVPESYAGKKGTCKACGNEITVPEIAETVDEHEGLLDDDWEPIIEDPEDRWEGEDRYASTPDVDLEAPILIHGVGSYVALFTEEGLYLLSPFQSRSGRKILMIAVGAYLAVVLIPGVIVGIVDFWGNGVLCSMLLGGIGLIPIVVLRPKLRRLAIASGCRKTGLASLPRHFGYCFVPAERLRRSITYHKTRVYDDDQRASRTCCLLIVFGVWITALLSLLNHIWRSRRLRSQGYQLFTGLIVQAQGETIRIAAPDLKEEPFPKFIEAVRKVTGDRVWRPKKHREYVSGPEL